MPNQYIRKQPYKMETVKLVRQSILVNDWAVSTQLAFYVNLHRAVIGPSASLTGRWRPDIDLRRMLTGHRPEGCISSCTSSSAIQKTPSVHLRTSCLPNHGLTFRNIPNPWIFTKLMDVIAAHLRQRAISLFPCLDDWLIRDIATD